MKNLKQVLALGMAFSLTMSAMAGAAFTDSADIKATEAVDMLSALGVINGYEDGSFKPEGTVTRAEAAKMIFTIRNGGNSDASSWSSLPTTFKDLNGYGWAEGYIKYCQSMGIIAGKSATQFDPGAKVTGVELAKMMLVTLGYNAETAGLTGAAWTNKTLGLAGENALLNNVNADLAAGLPRQYAAQLIYNSVLAPTVVTRDGQYTNKDLLGKDNDTIGEKYMSLKEAEGVIVSASYNSATKKYTYTVDSASTTAKTSGDAKNQTVVETSTNFNALLGQKVKALYKTENSKNVAYGMYSKATTVTATVGELEKAGDGNNKIKLAGTEYTLKNNDTATVVYKYSSAGMTEMATGGANDKLDKFAAAGIGEASALTLVDIDGDGKYDYAVVAPVTVAKVTYVGTNGVTAGTAYTYEDDVIPSGLAKNDFVTVSAAADSLEGKNVLAKINTVTGVVTGTKTNEVQIDGKWYKKASSATGDAITLNKTFTLAVVGGYYYNATAGEDVAATMDTLLLAKDRNNSLDLGVLKAKFVDYTGKEVVAEVSKVDGNDVKAYTDVKLDTLYTYKVKDGKYELKAVNASNDLGYEYVASAGKFTEATKTSNAKIGNYYIADDAVIYVKNTTKAPASETSYKMFTGKQVNGWSGASYGDSTVALYKTVNGVNYIVAAFITATDSDVPSATGEVGNYGYVVSEPYRTEVNDTSYDVYDIWTGSETVTVKDEDADNKIVKGDIIKYTSVSDGIIKDSNKVAGGSTAAVAVTGFNDKTFNAVKVDGSAISDTAITEDTKVLYFDTKNNKGISGGEFQLATEQADGSLIMNAWTVGSNGKAELIVFEVNNDIDSLANAAGTGAAGYTITPAGSPTGATVTYDKTVAAEGQVITITVTTTAKSGSSADDITITPSGTNVDTTPVTITVPANSPIGTKVTGTWTVKKNAAAITGAVTLTASGTVAE